MNRLVLILLPVLIFGCLKKEEDPLPTELPPITMNGENTFGCKIEGEIYIPDIRRLTCCEGQSIPIISTFPSDSNNSLIISTIRIVDDSDPAEDASVMFIVNGINNEGNYNIDRATVKYNNSYFYYDSVFDGSVKITRIDTINNIISGQFSFYAIDKLDTDTTLIEINEGRFDLKK